jgi:hypothetical protein
MVRAAAIVFALCVILVIAWGAGRVAQRKGRPFWLYFAAALLVGPLALLGALLLPRRPMF